MATLTFCTTVSFDHGALGTLGKALKAQGISRPLLCTDKGLVQLGLVARAREAMSLADEVCVYDETPENPTEEAVLDAARLYGQAHCDGVVAFGGGSSMDLGKAVALAATHKGALIDYTVGLGGAHKIGPVAPLIAVPTTAGTGSEVSTGSVIITLNGEKLILASKHLVPRMAICDPELTLGLPPRLTAATGMDALAHCIEAVCSRQVNPPADAVGYDGIRRIVGDGHLEQAVADGKDKDARWNMMMASTEGAMAFTKGLGAVHSMSHACGALPGLRLHHGTLNAVCLPWVLRFNRDMIGPVMERTAAAMGLPAGFDIASVIEDLNARLGLPESLGAMGVTEDMIDWLSAHAAKDVCTFTNPKDVSQDQYAALFRQAIAG
mgnify:CR=1 FL=1